MKSGALKTSRTSKKVKEVKKMSLFQSKKGAIPFGLIAGALIFAAAIMFLALEADKFAIKDLKGESQFSLLSLHSELQSLQLTHNQIVQITTIQSLQELATNGFNDQKICQSKFEGIPLLNVQECKLQSQIFYEHLEQSIKEQVENTLPINQSNSSYLYHSKSTPEKRFYQFLFTPNYLFSQNQNTINIISDDKYTIIDHGAGLWYSYYFALAVDLGFPLDQTLTTVNTNAAILHASCANANDLFACLQENLPNNWHFTTCETSLYQEVQKQVPFCVDLETSYLDISGKTNDLELVFTLDFTSTNPKVIYEVQDLQATYTANLNANTNPEGLEITWQTNADTTNIKNLPESYILYLTDYQDLDFTGSADQFNTQRFLSNVFERQELMVKNECPRTDEMQTQNAYICGDTLTAIFQDTSETPISLASNPYYIAITYKANNQEEDLNGFVEVS